MSKTKVKVEKSTSNEIFSEEDEPGGQIFVLMNSDKAEKKAFQIMEAISKLTRFSLFNKPTTIEDEVTDLIEEHDPKGMQRGNEELSILQNVLGLRELKIYDVMVPRADIVGIEFNASFDDLIKISVDKSHTRIPVYKETMDNVVGFVHIKDLIPLIGDKQKFDIKNILREILFVPPSMKVSILLSKMRRKRVHIALVLDEYGGTDGLVTMEDLMEEIVGEIEDEHDIVEEDEIKTIDKTTLEISARVKVEDLEKKLGVNFQRPNEDEDFGTIGGLIFFMLGHVPEVGEVVKHDSGYIFKVLDADERRIKKLLVSKI